MGGGGSSGLRGAHVFVQRSRLHGVLRRSGARPTLGAPFRRMDVEGDQTGTSKGLARHAPRRRAPAHLRHDGARHRRLRRVSVGRRGRPRRARPGRRARLRPGRGAARGRAARRRARGARQGHAHGRSGREAARADRQGARRGRRWVDVGEGLRAVARRGGRRLGVQPRGRRAELRRDRRRRPTARRPSAAVAAVQAGGRRDVHEALARRDVDYEVNTEGMAVGFVDDFLVLGHRGRVQADRRHAPRAARRSRTPTATRTPSATSRRTGSASSTSTRSC